MSRRRTDDTASYDARPEPVFTPFADASSVRTVGGLSFENGSDAISLHGSLDLPRDRAGLDRARAVKATLDAIVDALTQAELPDAVAETALPPGRVKNPFA